MCTGGSNNRGWRWLHRQKCTWLDTDTSGRQQLPQVEVAKTIIYGSLFSYHSDLLSSECTLSFTCAQVFFFLMIWFTSSWKTNPASSVASITSSCPRLLSSKPSNFKANDAISDTQVLHHWVTVTIGQHKSFHVCVNPYSSYDCK